MKIGKLVKDGGSDLAEINIEYPITLVGRDPEECEIFLDDKGISRKHATIKKLPTGFVITDNNSHNGTWVNSKKIKEHELQNGDRLVLGNLKFVFFVKDVKTDRVPPKKSIELIEELAES